MSQKPQLPDFEYSFSTDKTRIFRNYCKYMFTRTQSMFVYTGLPDSIPVQWLEQYLQRAGSCIIAKHEGVLYALIGNVSGERDAYYQPTKYIVANPWLRLSKEFTIDADCVYCRNDYDAVGLTPLISRYCGLMTENLLTVRTTDINLRMMNLLSAVDDDTIQSTKQYLEDLEMGKLGVVAEDGFFEGIKMQGGSTGRSDFMIQFIELQQYLKGSLYNELGINANFNMKREAINGDEAAMNDDALMPLIDDMLKQRRIMCEKINEMFDLNVSVDYGSSWHSNVAEKAMVAGSDLGNDGELVDDVAGDEAVLSEGDVSQLNDLATNDSSDSDSEITDSDSEVVNNEGNINNQGSSSGSEAGVETENLGDSEDVSDSGSSDVLCENELEENVSGYEVEDSASDVEVNVVIEGDVSQLNEETDAEVDVEGEASDNEVADKADEDGESSESDSEQSENVENDTQEDDDEDTR